MEWVDTKIKIYCTLTNFEDEAVTFTYTLWTGESSTNTDDEYGPRSVTVGSGQTITQDGIVSNGAGGHYGCSVQANEIEKCSTVTKFKNVAKERTSTNYKDVASHLRIVLN